MWGARCWMMNKLESDSYLNETVVKSCMMWFAIGLQYGVLDFKVSDLNTSAILNYPWYDSDRTSSSSANQEGAAGCSLVNIVWTIIN